MIKNNRMFCSPAQPQAQILLTGYHQTFEGKHPHGTIVGEKVSRSTRSSYLFEGLEFFALLANSLNLMIVTRTG